MDDAPAGPVVVVHLIVRAGDVDETFTDPSELERVQDLMRLPLRAEVTGCCASSCSAPSSQR